MQRIITLDAFDTSELPAYAVDPTGHVVYYNPAAADCMGCDRVEGLGRPCWRFARFKTCDGDPFCGRDCPVMHEAHAGSFPEMRQVLSQRPGREPMHFGLVTFLMPPSRDGRWAVMHMLEPIQELATDLRPGIQRPASRTRIPAAAKVTRRLGLLTIREREILDALAGSLDVETIADRFSLSTWTVRNHVQHILRKLHLHRQVDAILMLLENDPAQPAHK
jgi:DNA-binding CsgD family transcriptional regulator